MTEDALERVIFVVELRRREGLAALKRNNMHKIFEYHPN